ncbi:MAG: nucleotide exchange factor GrpE, partial [Acidobacteria bacterium]|nr:nucleotide exchange factor GrpE [Acidobacteriota bacterium]
MIEKNMPARNRIPVRFVDEDEGADSDAARGDEATPEELGRASSYEDETEMRRRTSRGDEPGTPGGRSRADERDDAGAPRHGELPENREDQDTTDRAGESSGAASASDATGGHPESRQAGAKVSPELELIAAKAEVRLLEEDLRKAKAERQELVELVARRQADFENYRKRMERERGETYNHLAGELAKQLLPVLDNLRRAVAAESSVEAGESEEFSNFLHGVELIAKQLNG